MERGKEKLIKNVARATSNPIKNSHEQNTKFRVARDKLKADSVLV